MSQHSRRDDLINNAGDSRILVWDELQVPPNMESDTDQWVRDFQLLVQIAGPFKCHWARSRERPDTVLLLTLWRCMLKLREFEDSPDAQLFWENLASKGILRLVSHETIYRNNWVNYLDKSFVQLFWVYFPASLDEDQLAEIMESKGINPPPMGFSVPRKDLIVARAPAKIWANKTKIVNGQETQLMMWPHFWRNEEKAEYRNIRQGGNISSSTVRDRFILELEDLKPVTWKEEFFTFVSFPRIV
ncbi:uncharacterized protein N7484_008238 [Penicillium longicatenatum]|uniref:uncharacterized protein n=1 Tax=Penicillium longicatenatum TaxID=1561947 RepID=UPI002548CFBF|nr:uncharacterized protein N7484_008238 [Penicillium longicatenatum]KAJ5634925.1 hypothetical protein N7484_008238 [Penicillium longicatenatum]